jgi:hypothetical protein
MGSISLNLLLELKFLSLQFFWVLNLLNNPLLIFNFSHIIYECHEEF